MIHLVKLIIILLMALITSLSGCTKIKEIKVSDNVKAEVTSKAEDNKIRNQPELKKKLSGLENQVVLSWIDDENVLTVNRDSSCLNDSKVILSSYNVESGEITEILNDSRITRIYDTPFKQHDGLILLGNRKQAFTFDPKEKNLELVLDVDKEFPNGVPGSQKSKDQMDLRVLNVQLIKHDYISYVSKLNREKGKKYAETAEYTILNYKENKKYTLEERFSAAGIDCKFDLTGNNIYIGQFAKLTKLNIETGEKVSMDLSMPSIENIFEDGTLLVYCIEENGTTYDKERIYKVDFDKKDVTRYVENYEGKNLSIDSIDFKNQFVCYTYFGDGEDRRQDVAMYGSLKGNKFVVTDKLFKNNEEEGCNDPREFIFSPNHNKFIVTVSKSKVEKKDDSKFDVTYLKDDKYLFELQ
ncbi:hypothetical protein B0P06_004366 [Clostridium saccharoperbutylacetonicum]|uniref:Lipoprotein n=1 Tax=Clostridium saccharoperbutylacetonicum N1-4(HMT) TaxID=931276 RepID=M1LVZ1_9CLOT|nr:hypothetical protein [Clostridium saccharoperbutylacetonicum]AGF57340.1 hypothetical protein Cspa_c35790 [Clostridium saccharoperbutylacetonicum N1-4(HMT)]NRT61897.1 hypothetical protein [Clostridium saccharoperbutylacetonicum]NSB44595.1 hypothetical protein [Clostridium saccharoperbutylacetonicum]